MKRDLIRMGGITLLGAAMLVVLPACGGSAGATTPSTATPQYTATNQPTATATPKATQPAATPTATVAPVATSSAGPSNSDLLALGRMVYEKTAGGVGCAYCHGLDGKGKGTPDIRGAEEARLRAALAGGVPAMSFIKLSEAEIPAVVAYLQYLATQP